MSSLNAVVLGSTGMLGHAILSRLSAHKDWRVCETQRSDPSAPFYLNATHRPENWAPVLTHFDYIINCIGILKSDVNVADTASVRNAISVNALFPHQLAEVAASSGARVIHMSTDGVFSGRSEIPYLETDPTDCLDVYGKTKALGECPAPNVLNIRCSIIGRDQFKHRGLIEWVLNSPDGSRLPGFNDQLWNGVTTAQFAALCERVLESDSFNRIRAVSGIHHFSPNSRISKYELLCLICQISQKDVTIQSADSGLPRSLLLGSSFEALGSICSCKSSWPQLIRQAIEN